MSRRGTWQGIWTIGRFNWPLYFAATAVLAVSVAGWVMVSPASLKWLCVFASLGAFYFLLASLGVSHLIYDRSDLYHWRWLERALSGAETEHMIFCHSGFDETSQQLRERFPQADWQILDHFEED